MQNIIFVGGVHGVGKGSICKKITEYFKITHLSASDIIKWTKISTKSNKLVKDIQSTQSILINGLRSIIKDDNLYLLDGHFSLLDTNSTPKKVPFSTFKSINPKAISLVIDSPEEIKLRLESRDKKIYPNGLIQEMQKLELDYAKEVSKKLDVPFILIEKGDDYQFINYLKEHYESFIRH